MKKTHSHFGGDKIVRLVKKLRMMNFLREVLIVSSGVALTFWISARMESHNKQEQIAGSLAMVRAEMDNNRNRLEGIAETISDNMKSYRFFFDHFEQLGQVPDDTLEYHLKHALTWTSLNMSRHALDALAAKAHYRELDNRLLVYLYTLYDKGDIVEREFENYCKNTRAIIDSLYSHREMKHEVSSFQKEFRTALENPVFRSRCSGQGHEAYGFTLEMIENINQGTDLLDSLMEAGDFSRVETPEIDF